MKALIINCTLKRSPEFSNTGALAEKAMKLFEENRLEVEPEMIRLVDYNIKPGTASDMKGGDEWPEILEKIKKCDIFIIATPVWMGHIASPAQRVIERMNALLDEILLRNEGNGQYYTYNKVAGCLVTGNEDGAHNCAAHILWAMQELGFTIPPNANAYWVGMAGGDKDYAEAGGRKYYYTNYTLRWMVANLVYMAKILRAYPITNNLAQLQQQAREESKMPEEEGGEKQDSQREDKSWKEEGIKDNGSQRKEIEKTAEKDTREKDKCKGKEEEKDKDRKRDRK